MGCVEAFVVLPVAAFHLPVMSRRIGTDQFVPDPVLFQMHLKKSGLVPVGGKAVCEFRPVIGLDTFNAAGERLYEVLKEDGRRIRALFLKSLDEAPSGVLVDSGILEEMLSNDPAVGEAGGGDTFDVDLKTLTGIIHLFIGLGDVLGVRGMERHDALFFEEAVQSGNGTGIAALHELYPENNKSCVGIAPAHIGNQFALLRSMLSGVMVRPSGEVTEGIDGAVEAAFPAVDILPVSFVFDGSIGDTVFFSIFDKR